MGHKTKVGSFVPIGSVGSIQTISIGFRPELVFFFPVETSSTSGSNFSMGVAKSDGDQFSVSLGSDLKDLEIPLDGFHTQSRSSNSNAIVVMRATSEGSVVDLKGESKDPTSLGFRVHWKIITPGRAFRIGYWALAGMGELKYEIVRFQTPASTGIQTISGLSFDPNVAIFFSMALDSLDGESSGVASFGWGIASSSIWPSHALSVYLDETRARGRAEKDPCIQLLDDPGEGFAKYIALAVLNSWISGGFVLNWTNVPTVPRWCYAIVTWGETIHPNVGTIPKVPEIRDYQAPAPFQTPAILAALGVPGADPVYDYPVRFSFGFWDRFSLESFAVWLSRNSTTNPEPMAGHGIDEDFIFSTHTVETGFPSETQGSPTGPIPRGARVDWSKVTPFDQVFKVFTLDGFPCYGGGGSESEGNGILSNIIKVLSGLGQSISEALGRLGGIFARRPFGRGRVVIPSGEGTSGSTVVPPGEGTAGEVKKE